MTLNHLLLLQVMIVCACQAGPLDPLPVSKHAVRPHLLPINLTLTTVIPKSIFDHRSSSLQVNATNTVPPSNATSPAESSDTSTSIDSVVWYFLVLFVYVSQLRRNDWNGLSHTIQQHTALAIGLPFLSGVFCAISLVLLLHLLRLLYRRFFFRRYYAQKSAILSRKNIRGVRESQLLLHNEEESEYEA
jgi:hypothetical protein